MAVLPQLPFERGDDARQDRPGAGRSLRRAPGSRGAQDAVRDDRRRARPDRGGATSDHRRAGAPRREPRAPANAARAGRLPRADPLPPGGVDRAVAGRPRGRPRLRPGRGPGPALDGERNRGRAAKYGLTQPGGLRTIASEEVVGRDPLLGDDRRAEGQLATQHRGGHDLGELHDFALAVAAHQLEALAVRWEAGPAAIGRDDERGDGHREIEVAVRQQLAVVVGGRGLGDVGDVLAGGDEDRGDPVGRVGAVVVGAGHEAAEVRHEPGAPEELGVRVHDLLDQVARDGGLRDHPLAACAQHVHLGALLVGGEVRLEEVVLELRVVGSDPLAGHRGRLPGHVLARGVPGRVVEAAEQDAARGVLLDVEQLAGPRRALGHLLDLLEVVVEPVGELARVAGALEDEGGRALHLVGHDGGGDAARLAQQPHAAVVARDQRALGGSERHVELALGVLAVDEQRPGHAERDLSDADEVLDVALGDPRIERVLGDVLERGAGALLQELAPGGGDLRRVVVLATARDLRIGRRDGHALLLSLRRGDTRASGRGYLQSRWAGPGDNGAVPHVPLTSLSAEAPPRLTSLSHGAGCGCKLPAATLHGLLAELPSPADARVLVGSETADDAAVYQLSDELALVTTADFFTPIVDEPYDFGRVAAANALSDVYAMGGTPITALNLVAWPLAQLGDDTLRQVLLGGAAVAGEAGVAVVGGHSIDDPEPKYGMAVTGLVDPREILRNSTARAGDRLYLTKPVRGGLAATATKRGLASPGLKEAALKVMTTLNRDAAMAAREAGASAATDVTGFGLLGHVHELARASGLSAKVRATDVPALPDVIELLAAAEPPIAGGTGRNRKWLEPAVDWADGVAEPQRWLLCDAMTSCGLLIAAPAGANAPGTEIGRLLDGEPGAITVE